MGDSRDKSVLNWRMGIVIFVVALTFEVSTAIAMTWIAYQTNTRGLAWICLLIWIVGLIALGRSFNYMFSLWVLVCILCGSAIIAVPIYAFVGYSIFSWIGLNKP
jgi:hypothetical protein